MRPAVLAIEMFRSIAFEDKMADILRILILNEDLGLGGVETMTVQLANSLSERAECDVSVAAALGSLRDRLSPDVRYLDIPKLQATSIPTLINRLSDIIGRLRPHIVHSQGASIAFLSRLAARRRNQDSVHVLTRHSRKTEKIPSYIGNLLMKWSCNHVIAISKSTHGNLRRAGFDPSHLSLVPNFLDLEQITAAVGLCSPTATRKELGIAEHRPTFSMAGRLIPAKRFDRFIEILAGVGRAEGIKPVGLILGEGVARPSLENLAHRYAELVDIRFLGYQENIYPYLAVSDAYLFPSEHAEVLPMALIEALAVGLPIICSDIPGNRDVIQDGHNGLIVTGSISAYVKRVIDLLHDRELAELLSTNARNSAIQQYDRPAVVSRILELYKDLFKGSLSRDSAPITFV